jgi:DNA-binding LytR/AlgR family response regulator
MFAYTSALGLPVATIYILARYIYLKNKPLANTTKSGNKSVIKSEHGVEIKESPLKQKLCIVPDYGKFSLEIQRDEFVFAESADNYCILFFYNNGILQKEIIRISLTKLLNQVQNDTIKKVHRSFIVNLKKVTKFKGNASGYKISIENIEKELTISRNYIDSVLPVLKNLAART